MFLFTFDAVPTKNNSCNCLGAIVNCWVDFDDFAGAEFIAHKFIESEGWLIKKDEEEAIIVSPQLIPIGKIAKLKKRSYNTAKTTGVSYLCITYHKE